MSRAHTNRRKAIKAYKKEFGETIWRREFNERCYAIRRYIEGPFICTLQDIMNTEGRKENNDTTKRNF
jgi:hypothetical protein